MDMLFENRIAAWRTIRWQRTVATHVYEDTVAVEVVVETVKTTEALPKFFEKV